MKFLTWKNNPNAVLRGVVEGDDGLFVCDPPEAIPSAEQFERMGCVIKIETVPELSEASFCGLLFDLDDLVVVADPLKHMAKVGWGNNKFIDSPSHILRALLRAKGFSLAIQFKGCPILEMLGLWILKWTASINQSLVEKVVGRLSWWERQKFEEVRPHLLDNFDYSVVNIGMNTRLLVEKLYEISVQKQLEIENWLMENELGPLNFDLPFPAEWRENWDTYVRDHNDPGSFVGSGDIQVQVQNTIHILQTRFPSTKSKMLKRSLSLW
jgi:hypothetical protein